MNYSSADILRMQEDAVRRVREMQARARKTAFIEQEPEQTSTQNKSEYAESQSKNQTKSGNSNTYNRNQNNMGQSRQESDIHSSHQRHEHEHQHQHHEQPDCEHKKPDQQNILGSLLNGINIPFLKDGFKLNSDIIVIGALIYLLYKEKADIKILLALGYILL